MLCEIFTILEAFPIFLFEIARCLYTLLFCIFRTFHKQDKIIAYKVSLKPKTHVNIDENSRVFSPFHHSFH